MAIDLIDLLLYDAGVTDPLCRAELKKKIIQQLDEEKEEKEIADAKRQEIISRRKKLK